MSARLFRTISRSPAAIFLLSFTLHACDEGPTDPAALDPYSFEATVAGSMAGDMTGSVVGGTSRMYGTDRIRTIGLEGWLPGGEQHLVAIYFPTLRPSASSYEVAPEWAPGDPLGSGEVGVLFATVVDHGTANFTHEAAAGTLHLEVDSIEHLRGEIEVEFQPAHWLDVAAGDVRVNARFRLK